MQMTTASKTKLLQLHKSHWVDPDARFEGAGQQKPLLKRMLLNNLRQKMAIQYEDIVQDSLRGAVKIVLENVRDNGFSGSQHLYITFKTNYPGVQMADYLRERHPDEVTIVLQYQFWDLVVADTSFSISLSFNDVREHLVVPYSAITGFVDPSVKFGLQFTPKELEGEQEAEVGDQREQEKNDLDQKKLDETSKKKTSLKKSKKSEAGKVVSMESFRKKKE